MINIKNLKIIGNGIKQDEATFVISSLKRDCEKHGAKITLENVNSFTFCQDGNMSTIYYDNNTACILQYSGQPHNRQGTNKKLEQLINKNGSQKERRNNDKAKDDRTSIQRY